MKVRFQKKCVTLTLDISMSASELMRLAVMADRMDGENEDDGRLYWPGTRRRYDGPVPVISNVIRGSSKKMLEVEVELDFYNGYSPKQVAAVFKLLNLTPPSSKAKVKRKAKT